MRLKVDSQNSETLDDLILSLIKRPPLGSGTEVKVDRYHRCLLVDDEPFFPFGPVSLAHPKDIPWMARAGFNTYFRLGGSYAYDQLMQQGIGGEERQSLFLQYAIHGSVLPCLEYSRQRFRAVRSSFASHPTSYPTPGAAKVHVFERFLTFGREGSEDGRSLCRPVARREARRVVRSR